MTTKWAMWINYAALIWGVGMVIVNGWVEITEPDPWNYLPLGAGVWLVLQSIFLIRKLKQWERRDGHRQANQTGGSGAQGHAGSTAAAIAAAHLHTAIAQQRALQNTSLMGPPHIFPPGGLVTIPAGALDEPIGYVTAHHCTECSAAIQPNDEHKCGEPSEHDQAVVGTMQKMAGAGLSPDEIAEDMGLVVGWRGWEEAVGGKLKGAGIGSAMIWPIDRPTMAVCVDLRCCGSKQSCDHHGYPICRLHAVDKKPVNPAPTYIIGQVALWGEVWHCETGYLATRGYPLSLDSIAHARAYRVPVLQ